MSAGKGDKPRPVNKQKYDENFDLIFGKKKNQKEEEENNQTESENE